MMGNAVVRSIVRDIRQASTLFSIIADESRDISNKEQLTCVLRWVSTIDLSVHEEFIGMYQLEKTVTHSLKDILLRCNVMVQDCKWQTYDGAANMSWSVNGVAARISSENPSTLYVHCGNYSLDLAVQGCAKASQTIRDALDFVQLLSVFIRSSPKRMAKYMHIVAEHSDAQVENLHLLCLKIYLRYRT